MQQRTEWGARALPFAPRVDGVSNIAVRVLTMHEIRGSTP